LSTAIDRDIWRGRWLFLLVVVVATGATAPQQLRVVAPLIVAVVLAQFVIGLPPFFRRHGATVSAVGLGIDTVTVATAAVATHLPVTHIAPLALVPTGLIALRFGAPVGVALVSVLGLIVFGAHPTGASLSGTIFPWVAVAVSAGLIGVVAALPRRAQHSALATIPEGLAAELLAHLGQTLANQTDPHRILEIVLETGSQIVRPNRPSQIQALALAFVPGEHNQLKVDALLRVDPSYRGRRFTADRGIFHEVLATGDTVLTDSHQPPLDQLGALRGLQIVLLPIQTALDSYGLALFAGRGELGLDREGDSRFELLLAAIGQCALALQNAGLQQEVRRERSEILLNEEESRHRLARDLHDGPVQRVAAISMQLEFIKVLLDRQPERVPAELEAVQALARQAAQEMRTLLFALRPITLESNGLEAAIEQFVQRLHDQEKVNIRLEANSIPRLDLAVEETVFAIVQEAAGNAKKHANGAPIVVRLMIDGGFLIAQVEDKGPGFDLQNIRARYGSRASLGLINMQERARMVDGRLAIDSALGQGTVVSLAVPFSASA